MKSVLQQHQLLEELLVGQQGVLALSDLEAFWGNRSAAGLQKRINDWIEVGFLRRICRGMYVGRTFDPWSLLARLYPDAAISTVSVLARAALVGTAPSEQVWATRLGASRDIVSGRTALHAWTLDPSLMAFGIEKQGALHVATPEKAFLDTLYFHMHGRRFPFTIDEIDVSRLDASVVESHLEHYRNLRFRVFVRGVLSHA